MTLEPATAQRLLHASKGLGWSRLCPFLSKLADTTTSGEHGCSVYQLLEAFEALNLLVGEAPLSALQCDNEHQLISDPCMRVSLALLWVLLHCHRMIRRLQA